MLAESRNRRYNVDVKTERAIWWVCFRIPNFVIWSNEELYMLSEFTLKVINIIKDIPEGQVATYGQIAALAGHPRAPRQVAGILKRYSTEYKLPWHRVIGSKGAISIKDPLGKMEQAERLREEGVEVSSLGEIDLASYGWKVDCFDL